MRVRNQRSGASDGSGQAVRVGSTYCSSRLALGCSEGILGRLALAVMQ